MDWKLDQDMGWKLGRELAAKLAVKLVKVPTPKLDLKLAAKLANVTEVGKMVMAGKLTDATEVGEIFIAGMVGWVLGTVLAQNLAQEWEQEQERHNFLPNHGKEMQWLMHRVKFCSLHVVLSACWMVYLMLSSTVSLLLQRYMQ
jgi:hypothetical protein